MVLDRNKKKILKQLESKKVFVLTDSERALSLHTFFLPFVAREKHQTGEVS